jgi:hypothetical protein
MMVTRLSSGDRVIGAFLSTLKWRKARWALPRRHARSAASTASAAAMRACADGRRWRVRGGGRNCDRSRAGQAEEAHFHHQTKVLSHIDRETGQARSMVVGEFEAVHYRADPSREHEP